MTGSMVMATGRMAGKRSNAYRAARRGAVRRTNAVRSDRRGKVMAVVLAAALAWGGLAMLTAEPARSDTGATQVISYIVRPGAHCGRMHPPSRPPGKMSRRRWMS